MYRIFYNLKVTGDVLFIVIDQETKPTEIKKVGDVAILSKDGKVVGANIFNIGEIVKLKTNGMIVTPDDALLDVINPMLEGAGMEKLPYCRDSGYAVMKIEKLEEHPLDEKANIVTLDCGGTKFETVSRYPNLAEGLLVVCVKDGTIKFDGTVFHKSVIRNINHDVELCCGKELRISEEYKEAFVPEGYSSGDDFFLGGK